MTEREKLVERIKSQKCRPGEIVVTLEEFFTGNNDLGSIGCNLGDEQPQISEFYNTLKTIRSKPNVQDVLVRICEYNEANHWPYSDTVYIIASSNVEEIRTWLVPLKPDEVYEGWMYGQPPKAPIIASGMNPYSIWWD